MRLTIHFRNKTTACSLGTLQWRLPDLCATHKKHILFLSGWTLAVCRVCWCPSVSKRFISVISFLCFVNLEGDIVSELHCLLRFRFVDHWETLSFTALFISLNLLLSYAPLHVPRKSVYRMFTTSKWFSSNAVLHTYFPPCFSFNTDALTVPTFLTPWYFFSVSTLKLLTYLR